MTEHSPLKLLKISVGVIFPSSRVFSISLFSFVPIKKVEKTPHSREIENVVETLFFRQLRAMTRRSPFPPQEGRHAPCSCPRHEKRHWILAAQASSNKCGVSFAVIPEYARLFRT